MNDVRVFQWFSTYWMILENFNNFDVFRVINDFRVTKCFSSIWMNFELLNDFLVLDWIWRFWLIFLVFFIDFDFLIESRLFELLPSIPMIVEYLNYYRDFWSFSRIWKIFEYLVEFREFERFSRIWLVLVYLNDFRLFEWISIF